ncbi:hypothetical protein MHYP_G00083500 [Metynnis hypsauchen]
MSVNLSISRTSYFAKDLHDQLVKTDSTGDEMLAPSSRLLQKRQEAIKVHSAMKLQREFQEVHQLISRYCSLKLMSEELLQITQQNLESIEKSIAHFTKQGNDTILDYNNTLFQLQSQLDKVREEGMVLESSWAHIQDTAAKKTLLLGTIKMATLNLYQSVCKRAKDTGDAPIAPQDTL